MSASLWMPIVTGAALFMVLFTAGLLVGGFVLWRIGRRKWRAVRSHGLVIGAVAVWEATAGLRGRWVSPAPVAAVGSDQIAGWAPQRARREMRRAVDRAERAVRAADDLGASTVGLPLLVARLRASLADLETVLRIEPSAAMAVGVREQVADVLRAAADVQRAAVSSASDLNGQRVRALMRDADQEIKCLDAGLASARSALPDLPG